MDEKQSDSGQKLDAGQELGRDQERDGDLERTPEQVRQEIEQTRIELGDTVAALAEKADVKGQAKRALGNAKEKRDRQGLRDQGDSDGKEGRFRFLGPRGDA